MLLSDAVNVAFILTDREDTVTEQMLILSCGRCGGVVSADQAAISDEHDRVIYSCPQDGTLIVEVGDRLSGRKSGFQLHEGDLSIRLDREELAWADFVDELPDSN
jgi:hypothetical protein